MAETPARKRAEIVSSFTDAGTGESFTAGETPMVEAARFANYEHAGLVRPAAPAKPAAERPKRAAAPKVTRPRTKRAKASAAAPAAPAPAEPAAAPDAGAGTSA